MVVQMSASRPRQKRGSMMVSIPFDKRGSAVRAIARLGVCALALAAAGAQAQDAAAAQAGAEAQETTDRRGATRGEDIIVTANMVEEPIGTSST